MAVVVGGQVQSKFELCCPFPSREIIFKKSSRSLQLLKQRKTPDYLIIPMNVGRRSLRLAVSFVVYPTFPDRKQNWISFEELAVSCSQSTFLNLLCQFSLQNQRTK